MLTHYERKSIKAVMTKAALEVGCLLFLSSIVAPFCYFDYSVVHSEILERRGEYRIFYWSFKATEYYTKPWSGSHMIDCWFYDHDFYEYMPGPTLSWIFILIFAAQVLTLGTGIVSIFVNSRSLASIPVITSATVIGLLIYVIQTLLERNFTLTTYQLGYWLTYPSMLLFLSAFILKQTSREDAKEITSTPTQTQT